LVSRGPKHAKRATVSFRALFYLPSRPGKPHYFAIGRYPDGEFTYPWKKDKDGKPITISCSKIDHVRQAAIDIFNRAKSGIDPRRPESSDVFEDVVKEYLDDHTSQRTSKATQKIFHTYIVPEWRYKKITDIKRSDVMILLDKIKAGRIKSQDGNGNSGTPIVARAAFAQLRSLFNWYAKRSDYFISPLVKGMTEDFAKAKARARVLDELELRIMWPLLDNIPPIFGAMFKLALLTGQRVGKISNMRRSDVNQKRLSPGSGVAR
jgi:hypothetical protein